MKALTIRFALARSACRVALCGTLGLLLLAAFAPGPARAQDDDEDNKTTIWNFDKKLLNGMMRGLGLRNGSEASIEYRERSPLVIPPSNNLPPPEQAGSAQAAAGWPVDPDQKRRQDASKKRKETNYRGYDPDLEGRNLTPSELNPPGASRSTSAGGATGPGNMGDEDGRPKRPSELGYFGGLFSSFGSSFGGQKEESATFTREPPRNSLTAPPPGYQTPSDAQPYGIGPKKDKQTVTPYDPAVGN